MKILLITHENADPDAIACVFIFKEFLKKADVFIPKGLSKVSRELLGKLGLVLDFKDNVDKKYDISIIVDTSNKKLIDYAKQISNTVIIFDHHIPINTNTEYYVFDTPSLSEALYLLFKNKIKNKKTLELIIYGILFDTSLLERATDLTMGVLNEICKKLNKNIDYFIKNIKKDPELDVKIALMKALKRLRIFKKSDLFIAITNVSSYESLVANKILKLYFDLVVILSYKKREKILRIVLRSRKNKVKAYDVARIISNHVDCVFGGHENASIVNIKIKNQDLNKQGILDKYFKLIINVIRNDLGNDSRKFKEITN